MDETPALDLDTLIDGQKVRPATIVFLVVTTLAMLADGFDLSAIGYVAPELVKHWHVARAGLTSVFSAGIIGLLFGGPLLGYVGDRVGRKRAIVIGLCIVGGVTLVTMAARTLPQFTVLRFLTGLGLGGVFPNVIALTAEIAPKRLRGRFIVIVNFGVPAGISIPGLVAAALIPRFGWPVLLLVGGLLPLGVAAVVTFVLPESIKYLAQRGDRDGEVRRRVLAIRPDLPVGASTRFAPARRVQAIASGSPKGLFAGGLAAITPLLWLALAANQMANFFSLSWLPTLLQSTGSSTAHAAINASLFSIGGLAGGVCLTFIVDRLGVIPMIVLFLAGVPLVAAIGTPAIPPFAFAAIIAGAGFCVTGINFNMGAALGMIYPTPVRALGTGWAQAMGRVGSLAAPLVGGALLALHLPMQQLLFAPAAALAIGALAAILLAILCVRRFGDTRLRESAVPGAIRPQLAKAARSNVV
ncbi:MFS transporter [Lichenicoccus sp.]|uniref:MFS transporter n=1 Tax=Lichenicoccus sp. TaxID=2781899 RepID=UPI003D0DF60A